MQVQALYMHVKKCLLLVVSNYLQAYILHVNCCWLNINVCSSVADWFVIPDTQSLLDFVRPDFLLLRVCQFLVKTLCASNVHFFVCWNAEQINEEYRYWPMKSIDIDQGGMLILFKISNCWFGNFIPDTLITYLPSVFLFGGDFWTLIIKLLHLSVAVMFSLKQLHWLYFEVGICFQVLFSDALVHCTISNCGHSMWNRLFDYI